MKTSRRNFVTKSILAAAGVSAGFSSVIRAAENKNNAGTPASHSPVSDPDAFKVSIFSKNLQWLDVNEMAKVVAEIGFDGVDLTVRPQGHVLPERVEEDLPKAAEAVRKAGKKIYMITTSITDADDPLTEKILKTASSLDIRHYRMGWGHYDDTMTIEENMKAIQKKLEKLALLNEKYSISGEYQNHSGIAREGIYFGGPIWDIASVLKNINSKWIGSQYDVYHATVEGFNAWPLGMKFISPYIRSIDIKDFEWTKKNGKWVSESLPLGEGLVDFKKYFGLIKQYKINVPVSLHFEYPLGGAESGADKITIKREDVISSMKKDLATLRKYLAEANLA